MGNEAVSSFQQSIWETIENNGARTILRNHQTLHSVQKYSVSTQHSSLAFIEGIYKWRSDLPSSCHIVEIYEYGIKKGSICDGVDQFYVISERVYRLGEIPSFSKPEAFLIIKQAIIGFEKLLEKFDLFSPNIMRLGINEQGQVRVWINENYASNILEEDDRGHPQREEAVVNNLIRLLSSKVFNNSLKGEYPFNMNFARAKSYILGYMQSDRNYYVDRIYRNRDMFTREYAQRREEFSRTRSRDYNSDYSKLTKLQEEPQAMREDTFSRASLNRSFDNPIVACTHKESLRNINRRPEPRFSAQERTNPMPLTNRSIKTIQQVVPQPHRPLVHNNSVKFIKTHKSYDVPAEKPVVQEKQLIAQSQPKVQRPPLPKESRQIQKPVKTISQKSQIRIRNDLEEVDSVIVIQEEDLLQQARDMFV